MKDIRRLCDLWANGRVEWERGIARAALDPVAYWSPELNRNILKSEIEDRAAARVAALSTAGDRG